MKMKMLVLLFAFLMPKLYADPLPGSLQLRLTESVGGTSVVITDQGACAGSCVGWTADFNPTLGSVGASGALGGWTVNVTTGLGFPFRPQNVLDLNSINATSAAGGGTLTVQVTQVGFNQPQQGYQLSFGGTLAGSAAGASVSTRATGTNDNTAFSTGYTIASLGPFNTPAFSGSTSGGPFSPNANPYSLTLSVLVISSSNGVTTYSGDAHLLGIAVPEPNTMMLVGAGLIGLALWRRRQAK